MVYTPQFLGLILRGAFGGFRDDNFVAGWTLSAGNGTLTTDGDIGIFTTTNEPTTGITFTKTVPGSLSSSVFKYLTIRNRQENATFTLAVQITYGDATTQVQNIGSGNTAWSIFTLILTSGKTISSIQIIGTSGAGSNFSHDIDWIYITSKPYLDVTKYMRSFDTAEHLGWQTGQTTVELQDELGLFWGNPYLGPFNNIVEDSATTQTSTLTLRTDINSLTSASGNIFTPATPFNVYQAAFNIAKVGSPTGNLTAKIYTFTGTQPNATPLTLKATSNPIDVTTLSTTTTLVAFTFPVPLFVEPSDGTQYFVVIDATALTTSAINNVTVKYQAIVGTKNKADFAANFGGVWTADNTHTLNFEVDGGYPAQQIAMSDILMLYALSDVTENAGVLRRIWGGPITQNDKPSTRETSSKRFSVLTSVQWNKALESVEDYAFHGAQSDIQILTNAGAPIGLITRVNTGFINPAVSGWNLATDITGYTSVNAAFQWNQIDVNRALTDLSDYSALQIGGLGIDFFVTHSEVFRWKQIGATGAFPTGWGTVTTFTDADWLALNLRNQIYDLKTALTVIGQTSTPQDGDFYTENYAANWVADANVTSFTDDTDSNVGAKSIKILSAGVAVANCKSHVLITTVNPSKLGSKAYVPYLKIWLKKGSNVQGSAGNAASITLRDAGGLNGITLAMGAVLDGNGWVSFVTPLLNASSPPAGTTWTPFGTGFSTDLTRLDISFFNQNAADANSFMKVDGFAITGYSAETAVDGRAGSGESQYGRRELVVFDQAVRPVTVPTSTTNLGPGIRQVARMELVKWWNPIVQGQMIGDADPNNNFLRLHPAQTVQITSPHHNYSSAAFRILSVKHHWATPDTNIRSTIEITDFFKATEVRTPGDLFRELSRFSALSQADVEQAKWQAIYSYGGLVPTIYKYTSDNDQTGTFIS